VNWQFRRERKPPTAVSHSSLESTGPLVQAGSKSGPVASGGQAARHERLRAGLHFLLPSA